MLRCTLCICFNIPYISTLIYATGYKSNPLLDKGLDLSNKWGGGGVNVRQPQPIRMKWLIIKMTPKWIKETNTQYIF